MTLENSSIPGRFKVVDAGVQRAPASSRKKELFSQKPPLENQAAVRETLSRQTAQANLNRAETMEILSKFNDFAGNIFATKPPKSAAGRFLQRVGDTLKLLGQKFVDNPRKAALAVLLAVAIVVLSIVTFGAADLLVGAGLLAAKLIIAATSLGLVALLKKGDWAVKAKAAEIQKEPTLQSEMLDFQKNILNLQGKIEKTKEPKDLDRIKEQLENFIKDGLENFQSKEDREKMRYLLGNCDYRLVSTHRKKKERLLDVLNLLVDFHIEKIPNKKFTAQLTALKTRSHNTKISFELMGKIPKAIPIKENQAEHPSLQSNEDEIPPPPPDDDYPDDRTVIV